MRTREDALLEAGARLEIALEAQSDHEPQPWATRVDQALAAIESAVAGHTRNLQADGGGVVEVSNGQAPSPGMGRQVKQLHQNLADLQQETEVLRSSAREALNAAGEGGPVVQVRERAAHLLAALDRYVREETNVILASTTIEVGAGD